METIKFVRRPFYIDAVQVTEENIEEVAKWCGGDVRTNSDARKYIKVRVHRPFGDRQTQAFIGDWVLYSVSGYKVYTPRAFANAFEEAVLKDDNGDGMVIESSEPIVKGAQKSA